MGTGRTVRTDAQGDFLIDGITRQLGQLLFRYDLDHDGSWTARSCSPSRR